MKAVRRHPVSRVGDILAFVFTIAIGIAMGGALSLGEAIEERFDAEKRRGAKHGQERVD